jgi:hypothetical protein
LTICVFTSLHKAVFTSFGAANLQNQIYRRVFLWRFCETKGQQGTRALLVYK